MNCIEGIKSGLSSKQSSRHIARKIFLSYSTEIFKENPDIEFFIKNEISERFEIPFSTIEIVGSSKTGLSFFKDKKFEPGKSDLDIAIISLPLFNKFNEISHTITNGYTNLVDFPFFKGYKTDEQFRKGLSNGFVNPFFMPNCELKALWLEFFNQISNKYFELFKNINGGIYASEYFFEFKQIECIEKYKSNSEFYDKLIK